MIYSERKPNQSLTWNDLDRTTFLFHNTLYVLAVDIILYPSDLLTTRLQADQVSNGKVRISLFRGFGVNTTGHFPGQFLYYTTYEYYNQQLRLLIPKSSSTKTVSLFGLLCNAIAGVIAEAIAAFSYLPTDIISQRLQVHSNINFHRSTINSSTWRIIKHVYNTEGIGGFFRGFMPYMMVHGPGSAVWWASYEATKASIFKLYDLYSLKISETRDFKHENLFRLAAFIISGAVSGAAGYIAVNPLEVAKTRLQLLEISKKGDKKRLESGFFHLLRDVYRKEGFIGLFKGIKPRLMIRVPVSSIAFVGYEYLKESSLRQ